jgi:hypothetical protein
MTSASAAAAVTKRDGTDTAAPAHKLTKFLKIGAAELAD